MFFRLVTKEVIYSMFAAFTFFLRVFSKQAMHCTILSLTHDFLN